MQPVQPEQSATSGSRIARSIGLVVMGNALTPIVGAVSGPILAQALGVDGRGQVAAATAPLMFGLAIGTLGLPEAMTYRVATDGGVDPRVTRRVLRTSILFALVITGVIYALSGILSDHDRSTQRLMWVATLFLVPSLIVLVFRGVASGLQLFRSVAGEQVVSALSRAAILIGFLAIGQLESTEAMLSIAAPLVLGGVVYVLTARGRSPASRVSSSSVDETTSEVYRYGRRVWLGSIGGILLFRLDQLVVAPLSNIEQLGLYIVAVNVAEILMIAVTAVRDVTFATDAASNDNDQAYVTSRLATGATVLVGALMALTAPVLVPFLFGSQFDGSVQLVWILLASVVVLVPGSVAGALLTSRGHPQLRSIGLIVAAVVNAAVLVIFVPSTGALGAAWATFVGNAVFAMSNVVCAHRYAQLHPAALFGLKRSDLAAIRRTLRSRTTQPDDPTAKSMES
jgi:O-antigen/teichoic acid export membrane protein